MKDLQNKWQSFGLQLHHCQIEKDYFSFEIEVQAKPGSKKERIEVGNQGQLVIAVNSRPIDGEANDAILVFLGKSLGLAPSSLELVRGGKSKLKRIRIHYQTLPHKNEQHFIERVSFLLSPHS